jgi:hypothetical protein
MPQKPNSPEMERKNARGNMRAKVKSRVIPSILNNGMWPHEHTFRCGKCYEVYVTSNARIVMKHTRTKLLMVYEAHTGDSYHLDPENKTVFHSHAQETHKPTEAILNATKDIHVANGWLPEEFKNGLMILCEAASRTF